MSSERARQTVVVARRQIVCHLKGEEAEEGKICIAFGRSLLERREMDQGISEHWQYLQYCRNESTYIKHNFLKRKGRLSFLYVFP